MGRGTRKPRNPFRTIRKAARRIGYMLIAFPFAAALGVFIWGFWTKEGWGAWALTLPLIGAVGIVAVAAVLMLIAWPFVVLGEWWKKRERAYEQKVRESRI